MRVQFCGGKGSRPGDYTGAHICMLTWLDLTVAGTIGSAAKGKNQAAEKFYSKKPLRYDMCNLQ